MKVEGLKAHLGLHKGSVMKLTNYKGFDPFIYKEVVHFESGNGSTGCEFSLNKKDLEDGDEFDNKIKQVLIGGVDMWFIKFKI